MLEAYHQARLDIMTPRTIKNAWKTAGIYPRDRAKALSSKFVMLEAPGIARQPVNIPEVRTREKTPDFIADMAAMTISTPHNSQSFKALSRRTAMKNPALNNPEQRLVNRKVASLIDNLTDRLAKSEARVDYFEAKESKKAKNVRQKVKINPSQKFTRLGDVREAKRVLRSRVVYRDEAPDTDVVNRSEVAVSTPPKASNPSKPSAPRRNPPRNTKK
ncbi:hypothetical protein F4861DRAFT_547732 [Xylaria intraflava]|nr:hypothetical protein F4861DRAFT_547732 [Xylaria intraflava]